MLSPKTSKTRLRKLFCDILDFTPAAINAPSIEIVGQERLTTFGSYTIDEYSNAQITLSSRIRSIRIKGKRLSITSCKDNRIDVVGAIASIMFTDEKENL